MNIKRFLTNALETNTYLVIDEQSHEALLVDPGSTMGELDEAVRAAMGENSFSYILLTHGHFDHIGGAAHYQEMTGAKIVCEALDEPLLQDDEQNLAALFLSGGLAHFKADITLLDGGTLPFGKNTIRLLHTPGHTQGSCCYLIGDIMFTGDTLMRRCIGRTDFQTGDYSRMKHSLEKLKALSGDYTIYPGHGDATTLREEKDNNPYLGNLSYDDLY